MNILGALFSAVLAFGVITMTARALKVIQPPFGKLAAQQTQLEGELRFAHSRLINHSEEVAFYGGHKKEESILYNSYLALVKHMNYIFRISIFYNMMEGTCE